MGCTSGVSLPSTVDRVNDGWTDFIASVVMVGTPDDTHEREAGIIPALIDRMSNITLPCQDRDPCTSRLDCPGHEDSGGAQGIVSCWCKRRCFHDEYLEALDKPNVTLVDTIGQSIKAANSNGFVLNGTEYSTNMIVWSIGTSANGTIGDLATETRWTLSVRMDAR